MTTVIERARAWANSIYSKCAPTDPVCAHLAGGPGIVKALLEELETQQDAFERILAQTKEGHWTEVQTLKFEHQEAVARLKERAETAATLALNYRQVLDACPPCRVHGAGCVAHAVEWISMVVKEAG